jgi:CysZ protein
MFASVAKAAAMVFDRRFVGLLLASLLLTAILFAALIIGLEYLLAQLPTLGSVWVNRILEIAGPVLLVVVSVFFLGAPVAAIIGSLFLDRIAARVDARFFPNDPRAAGKGAGIKEAIRLVGLVILANLVLLPFDIGIPGVSEIASVLANGWLLGREYFELASLRHISPQESDALRRRHGGQVYLAGLLVSVMTIVPGVNLLAPFFGSALMAHLFKRLTHGENSA